MTKNKQIRTAVGALLLASCVLASCVLARPMQAATLYQENFENNDGGWTPMGNTAKVKVENLADNVKEGKGSLRFDYSITAGEINVLSIPAAVQKPLETLQTITFWVKANHDSSLVFVVREQGGGSFNSVFFAPKGKWQRVEISVNDLVFSREKTDPKDDNGKLDLNKIEGAALIDAGQFLAQVAAQNAQLAQLLNVQTGPHTFYVDDVTFSDTPLTGKAANVAKGATTLDDFSSPQAAWFGIGDIGLQNLKAENPANNALQANYWQEPNRIVAMAKPIASGSLTGKESLNFKVASEKQTVLIVQVEEYSGGKYNINVPVPGNVTPTTSSLRFKDFTPADDSKDDNNRLDLDQVKQLLFIDVTGLVGQANLPNTLWFNHIQAK